jgi:pimeloyl-ACP methyl ester carboxylesterase
VRPPDERFAQVGEVELCYEEFGSADAEPMLLVMGLATQMIGWHEEFCDDLAGRGYRVIRFDNRDVGRSSRLHSAGVPGRTAMMLGLGTPAYTLSDLAGDAARLLDHLGIEDAHVVGASMGGMIAQMLAIEHPRRVRSLASLMSGTGSRWSRMPRLRALGTLLRAAPNDREGFVEHTVRVFDVIGSPGFDRDEERLRDVAAMSFDRGRYPQGIARQMHAITASPNRERMLRRLRVPTVVIHGDKDPLVRFAAGKATARAIPGARLHVIERMGHDLPRAAWPRIIDAIIENAERARAGGRAVPAITSRP